MWFINKLANFVLFETLYMNLRKGYKSPKIEEVDLDVSISILMQTEYTPPGGAGPFESQGSTEASSLKSTQEDDSGIKENPFK